MTKNMPRGNIYKFRPTDSVYRTYAQFGNELCSFFLMIYDVFEDTEKLSGRKGVWCIGRYGCFQARRLSIIIIIILIVYARSFPRRKESAEKK